MGWFDDFAKKTAKRDLEREFWLNTAVCAIDSCDQTSNFIFGLMESQKSDRQRRKAAISSAKQMLKDVGLSTWSGADHEPLASKIYVSYLERKGNGGVRPRTPIDDLIESLASQQIECDFEIAFGLLFIANKKAQAALPVIVELSKNGTFDAEFLKGCLLESTLAELPEKMERARPVDSLQIPVSDADDDPQPTIKELLEDYREQDFYRTQKKYFERTVETYPEYLADPEFSPRDQVEKELAEAKAALADWDAYLLKEIMNDQEKES